MGYRERFLPNTVDVCDQCGALVLDREAHDRFHELTVVITKKPVPWWQQPRLPDQPV